MAKSDLAPIQKLFKSSGKNFLFEQDHTDIYVTDKTTIHFSCEVELGTIERLKKIISKIVADNSHKLKLRKPSNKEHHKSH